MYFYLYYEIDLSLYDWFYWYDLSAFKYYYFQKRKNPMNTEYNNIIQSVEDRLKTVYDPEFPLIDIFTLGLIYDIKIKGKDINILMTFTTPYCPMADMLKEMITNGINEILPDYKVILEVTFDPMWTIEKIKDPDLKRMFE